jgi:hypothetical protein
VLIKDARFPQPSFTTMKSPGKWTPSMFPNGGPYGDSLPLPEPSFTSLEFSTKILLINEGQFTFYPMAQCDWINSGGHMYKNTTHQNVLMLYLGFNFCSRTTVAPLTLPPTFWRLSKFQFPLTWWWTIVLLMSYCTIHLSFYLFEKKRTVGILTLCRSYLKPYCVGRQTEFFQRAFNLHTKTRAL